MATLILTAVGTALGGPVGGALGALVGGTIDRAVLSSPGAREGPRLTDLAVQTSSYGSQIPRLYGTTRVAGTVIWSTDLIESRSTARAGKGQPSTTTYSYSASFAVLLSARRIVAVGRIWADGNLLRGAAGDWKASTGFRLHTGDEDQQADPLIASAVGIAAAPAHRGAAYAVFENLALAGFGNRIPSLTFEVVADEGDVDIGTIAADLVSEVSGRCTLRLGGFAASGDSGGAAITMLAEAGGAWLAPAGDGLVLRDDRALDATVADGDVAAAGHAGRSGRAIAPVETVPSTVTLAYYDPARDYQAGVQSARRPGPGRREQRLELPAVLGATAAKAIAEAALIRAEAGRTTRTVTLGCAGLAIAPGICVAIAGEAGRWRVVDSDVEGYIVTLTLAPLSPPAPSGTASSGRVAAAPDRVIGTTLLAAFELPGLGEQPLAAPRLSIAATGTGEGWRRAALLVSSDDGASWIEAGDTAVPATLGVLEAPLAAAPSTLCDRANRIVVRLARADMTLADADDALLDAGANLAVVGDELIQFGAAVPLGEGRWALSRLWRGRRGTEAASGRQQVGDRFVLLDSVAVRTIDLPPAALGTRIRVMATGVGDAAPVETALLLAGASVAPPAPVHLAAVRRDDSWAIDWTRRSRAGWRWIDGVDAPLAEDSEAYRVTIDGTGEKVVIPAVTAPILLAADAVPPLSIRLIQQGSLAPSLPATLVIAAPETRP